MIQEPENIDDLMNEDDDLIVRDDGSEVLEQLVSIDLDEADQDARDRSEAITDGLSNYYFDEKYIKEHPYIPTKIMMEMDNVRRLYKMLIVNEKAQDALIKAISISPSKGTLFISLTSMQKGTLLIQKQLNDLVTGLETIFQRMQDEADKQYSEKEKEEAEDGSLTLRGAKEFIKMMQARMNHKKMPDGTVVDRTTGEIISEPEQNIPEGASKLRPMDMPEGATPIEDIVG